MYLKLVLFESIFLSNIKMSSYKLSALERIRLWEVISMTIKAKYLKRQTIFLFSSDYLTKNWDHTITFLIYQFPARQMKTNVKCSKLMTIVMSTIFVKVR